MTYVRIFRKPGSTSDTRKSWLVKDVHNGRIYAAKDSASEAIFIAEQEGYVLQPDTTITDKYAGIRRSEWKR